MQTYDKRISCCATLVLGLAGVLHADPVALQQATATFFQDGFPVSAALDGDFSDLPGWAIFDFFDSSTASAETAVFETATDVGFSQGTPLTVVLHQLHKNRHITS